MAKNEDRKIKLRRYEGVSKQRGKERPSTSLGGSGEGSNDAICTYTWKEVTSKLSRLLRNAAKRGLSLTIKRGQDEARVRIL